MFGKLSSQSPVKNILVFSLSNLGDVVMASLMLDVLLRDFPSAHMTVIVGDKGTGLFDGHPRIETMVYDKHASLTEQVRWFRQLRARPCDVFIDLRHTVLGLFLPARWRTPFIRRPFPGHLCLKHLECLRAIYPDFAKPQERLAIIPSPIDAVAGLPQPYAVLAPGAADTAKRWHPAGFAALADRLAAKGYTVVFVGGRADIPLIDGIRSAMKSPAVSLAGQTDLRQLAFVLTKAALAIAHDSGVMHLASYFQVPLVALWGPTPLNKSDPWSPRSAIVYRGKNMSAITPEDVLDAVAQVT